MVVLARGRQECKLGGIGYGSENSGVGENGQWLSWKDRVANPKINLISLFFWSGHVASMLIGSASNTDLAFLATLPPS